MNRKDLQAPPKQDHPGYTKDLDPLPLQPSIYYGHSPPQPPPPSHPMPQSFLTQTFLLKNCVFEYLLSIFAVHVKASFWGFLRT